MEALILDLDRAYVSVGPAEQDVVEDGFFRAEALDRGVDELRVLGQWAADEGQEPVAEVPGGFFRNVGLRDCG